MENENNKLTRFLCIKENLDIDYIFETIKRIILSAIVTSSARFFIYDGDDAFGYILMLSGLLLFAMTFINIIYLSCSYIKTYLNNSNPNNMEIIILYVFFGALICIIFFILGDIYMMIFSIDVSNINKMLIYYK